MSARSPVLVTGMPRSGNTWVARLLATAPGTALTGREPMNPRPRQYALGGSLPGWVSLDELDPRQQRALKTAYRGINPWVYSRYGRRQWAGPLPVTRKIVKDPFAMLSLPAVVGATGARALLVYRHPGAALASFRRMGWWPDFGELTPIVEARNARGARLAVQPTAGDVDPAVAMGTFWAALYSMALDDAARVPDLLVVSHRELSAGGEEAARALFAELGLPWSAASRAELEQESTTAAAPTTELHNSTELHNFKRRPSEVADSWRRHLDDAELGEIERVTAGVRDRLDATRFRLVGG